MQGRGGVEIGLGRFHFDGDGDELRHFGGAVADDVTADHAVGGGTTSFISTRVSWPVAKSPRGRPYGTLLLLRRSNKMKYNWRIRT